MIFTLFTHIVADGRDSHDRQAYGAYFSHDDFLFFKEVTGVLEVKTEGDGNFLFSRRRRFDFHEVFVSAMGLVFLPVGGGKERKAKKLDFGSFCFH